MLGTFQAGSESPFEVVDTLRRVSLRIFKYRKVVNGDQAARRPGREKIIRTMNQLHSGPIEQSLKSAESWTTQFRSLAEVRQSADPLSLYEVMD